MKHVFPVNINDMCRVILTDHGAKVLNAHYRKLEQEMLVYNLQQKVIRPDMHKGQILDMQLWELMQIFGEHLFVGAEPVFENNKLLIEKR